MGWWRVGMAKAVAFFRPVHRQRGACGYSRPRRWRVEETDTVGIRLKRRRGRPSIDQGIGMTSVDTGHGPAAAAAAPRSGHAAANALVGLAVGFATLSAGLDLETSLLVAALTTLLAFLLPARIVHRGPDRAALMSVTNEVRRGDAARMLGLELALDRLRSVLESLREGVLVVDGGGEIVLANPEVQRALKDPNAPPIGRIVWDLLPEELAGAARQAMAALDDDERGHARFSSIACGARVFDLTAVRVRSRESAKDFGTVFLLVDVTAAHELSQSKDRFLSGISHELRTPLTNICAYSELLRHMPPGESKEWPEFVRIVHDESIELSRLIDAVFDYTRLESGEVAFRLEAVDVTQLAQQACERARRRATDRGIELACDLSAGPLQTLADRERLDFVIAQLLDNALKFTPRGGRVQLAVREAGRSIQVAVEDSGPGVAQEQREQVFEKFSQQNLALTDKPTGAGLGLATCRAILERLGGTIGCRQSALGGAAFVAEVPPMARPGHADNAESYLAQGGGAR